MRTQPMLDARGKAAKMARSRCNCVNNRMTKLKKSRWRIAMIDGNIRRVPKRAAVEIRAIEQNRIAENHQRAVEIKGVTAISDAAQTRATLMLSINDDSVFQKRPRRPVDALLLGKALSQRRPFPSNTINSPPRSSARGVILSRTNHERRLPPSHFIQWRLRRRMRRSCFFRRGRQLRPHDAML
jgi:hypothetical protein